MSHRTNSVPETWSRNRADELHRKVAQALNSVLRGETNNHFTVTLAPGTTETEVRYSSARPGVVPVLTPLSASAAAAAAIVWASAELGKVVLHHDSDPATDRAFGVVIIG